MVTLNDVYLWDGFETVDKNAIYSMSQGGNSHPSPSRYGMFVHTSVKGADSSVFFRLCTAKERM